MRALLYCNLDVLVVLRRLGGIPLGNSSRDPRNRLGGSLIQFFLAFGLSLASLLGACRSPENPSASRAQEAQAADPLDPRAQMLKAMDAATSYRRSMIVEGGRERIEETIEVSCPGRSHYRQTLPRRISYDIYYIDGFRDELIRGRRKLTQSDWKIAPGCPGAARQPFGTSEDNVVSGRDYLDLGRLKSSNSPLKFSKQTPQIVDGVTCEIRETEFIGNFDEPNDVQFALGSDDGLPRRVVVNSPHGRIEILYWDWNSPSIQIDAPN